MIDESMDKEQMAQPPQPYEFRSQSTWKRLLIMVGGVLMNLLLAFLLFWLILFKWGETYIPADNAKYGFIYHPIAHEIGLLDGDRVLQVGSVEVKDARDIAKSLLLDDPKTLTVLRNGAIFEIDVPEDYAKQMLAEEVKQFADYRFPTIVDSVIPASNAAKGGLMKNDSIVSVNEKEVIFFNEFSKELGNNKDSQIIIGFYRNGELMQDNFDVDGNGKLGFVPKSPAMLLGYDNLEYGFWEALPAGVSKGVNILVDYVKQFKLVFSREGAKQLGGFGAIGNLFPAFWDWQFFWYITAFISLILAFMNILPIPALDGGHVIFLLYEIVTGKKPSDKFMEKAQVIGMVILFALIIYANGNDIYRWLIK
jgi:regulator of sigma E protease